LEIGNWFFKLGKKYYLRYHKLGKKETFTAFGLYFFMELEAATIITIQYFQWQAQNGILDLTNFKRSVLLKMGS
jgi:hypothetical protein